MYEGKLTTPREYITEFRGKTGRLPSQLELTKNLGISPEKAITELINTPPAVEQEEGHKPKKVEVKAKRSIIKHAIVAGLLFISAVTFTLSVYFTGLWFTGMFNLFIAGSISIAMVSYMVLIPQAIHYVRGVIKFPVWSTFAIALVFSMGSTVAGQYNKLTENVNVQEVNDRATLEVLRSEEESLLSSIQENREQRAFHQQTMESLSTSAEDRMDNWSYINTERNMVDELGYEIEQEQARLSEVRDRILTELGRGSSGATEERSDFYSWLAQIVNRERNQVEFMVSALPAIFIDIIAALSLSVALQVKRSK